MRVGYRVRTLLKRMLYTYAYKLDSVGQCYISNLIKHLTIHCITIVFWSEMH